MEHHPDPTEQLWIDVLLLIFFLLLTRGHFFHCFLEREEGRETLREETSIDWSPLIHTRTRDQTHNPLATEECSNPLSHPARAWTGIPEKAFWKGEGVN